MEYLVRYKVLKQNLEKVRMTHYFHINNHFVFFCNDFLAKLKLIEKCTFLYGFSCFKQNQRISSTYQPFTEGYYLFVTLDITIRHIILNIHQVFLRNLKQYSKSCFL